MKGIGILALIAPCLQAKADYRNNVMTGFGFPEFAERGMAGRNR